MACDLRAELLSFPAGKHDDQVDALGSLGQLPDQMVVVRRPQPEEPKRVDAYAPLFDRQSSNSILTI
jgi:hypothetical protein